MILHGVYIIGIMNYILVGGLILLFMYHHLCVYFLILVMYILVLFLIVYLSRYTSFILYSYFFVDISPSFTLSQLCEIYPQLNENFWGVYAYVFHHMQLYVCFEICLLNINYPI